MKYSIKLRYTSLNISWWGPWWWSESNAVGDGVASPSSSSCNIEALLFSVSKEEVGSPLEGEEEKFRARRLRQETTSSEVTKKRATKWEGQQVEEEEEKNNLLQESLIL